MPRPARVIEVKPLGGYALRLTFSDGLVRELDLGEMLVGDVFDSLREPGVFDKVRVDPVAGTICWPMGVDLDPDVLHGDQAPARGRAPSVIREYQLGRTG